MSSTLCGGLNGAGAETDNVFLLGDGERTDSGDERNPPALVALGVVQALAREMTRDLQRQRDDFLRVRPRPGGVLDRSGQRERGAAQAARLG